jgi:hypothetical protein
MSKRCAACALLAILVVASDRAAFAQSTVRPPSRQTPSAAPAQPVDRLRDRGEGVPTSMFGTYLRGRELMVYPFFEYYRDRNYEYSPAELGFVDDVEFRGRYRATEGLMLVAYGLTDDLIVEFEAAMIKASLGKAADDSSALPAKLRESGLGDVEGQVRWRWRHETETRPEIFSYTELVVPHSRDKPLIGTTGLEIKFGTGLVRGFSWGTLTVRGAVQFEEESDSHFDLGEYAVEYLRRLSSQARLYVGVEGTQDEVELITELQWHLGSRVFAKFNNAVGLTSKATDWAPEIGVVFRFGGR